MIIHEREVTLRGFVYGPVWQGQECWKPATLPRKRRGHPILADSASGMAATVTDGDGDFQECRLTQDSEFVFTRRTLITNEDDLIVETRTRERRVPVGKLPSVARWVGEKISDDFG